jgi:hypothetical protein
MSVLLTLRVILQVFTSVTLEMSRARTPTLPWAIPCYHRMRQSLSNNIEKQELPDNLRRAAAAGLARLNHYYELALENHYNIVATGTVILHYICVVRSLTSFYFLSLSPHIAPCFLQETWCSPVSAC